MKLLRNRSVADASSLLKTMGTLMALLFVASATQAFQPEVNPKSGPNSVPFSDEILSQAGVSEEEGDKIREIREKFRAQARKQHESLHESRRKLRELLATYDAQEDAILAQAKRIGAIETEVHQAHLKTLLAIRNHLTPEQWQRSRSSMREHRMARHTHRGKRPTDGYR